MHAEAAHNHRQLANRKRSNTQAKRCGGISPWRMEIVAGAQEDRGAEQHPDQGQRNSSEQ
jgi:hypothetical protein